jgi:S-adenosylmethionine-diacylgycerolhomoserine-N-methlytransferase
VRSGRGSDHAARLDSFYSSQAADYDDFRKRLLHGRAELMQSLVRHSTSHNDQGSHNRQQGGRWIELGGGTGANLEHIHSQLPAIASYEIVDLCRPLLEVARQRIERQGYANVTTSYADATSYQPAEPVDVVVMSYSLTMIPDWIGVLENAWKILRPGGLIGVVDFYVSRKHPLPGTVRHSAITRGFWPIWFSWDDVYLSADHLPRLSQQFEIVDIVEARGKIPYMPLARAPHYRFVGRKKILDQFN